MYTSQPGPSAACRCLPEWAAFFIGHGPPSNVVMFPADGDERATGRQTALMNLFHRPPLETYYRLGDTHTRVRAAVVKQPGEMNFKHASVAKVSFMKKSAVLTHLSTNLEK